MAEASILLVVRKDEGLFIDGGSIQVNYPLQGNRYIVDGILTKPPLSHVGFGQDRIIIKKGK